VEKGEEDQGYAHTEIEVLLESKKEPYSQGVAIGKRTARLSEQEKKKGREKETRVKKIKKRSLNPLNTCVLDHSRSKDPKRSNQNLPVATGNTAKRQKIPVLEPKVKDRLPQDNRSGTEPHRIKPPAPRFGLLGGS